MGGVERFGDLDGDDQGLIEGNSPALQTLGERLTLEELHHEEGHTVLLADIMKRADVRVTDPSERLRFTLEAFELHRAWRRVMRAGS